jgi:GNAT superfamily N-acetyltransferase
MKMIIRKAVSNDLRVIAGFQLMMARESEGIDLDRVVLENGIKAVFDDPSKGQYYVTIIDNKVVASLMITYEWSDWRNGMVWWIQSVFVMADYRQKGVFKAMFNYLKDIVSSEPAIRGLRLYVDKSNFNAQAVYEVLGMNGEHYQVFEWIKS